MSEELLENYEANYINIEHLSIDHAIKNEYPIISLFTPLNAQQAHCVLNTTINEKFFINYDLCCFLTIFIDAVSCLISNVSIQFGNQFDVYKLLKKILCTIKTQHYSNEIDSDKFDIILNIIKRSENRMKHTQFSSIMKEIRIAFNHNFHENLKFFEEKLNPVDNFKVCNSDKLTVVESSFKQKDISQYFMKKDNFMEDTKQMSIDSENKMTMDLDEDQENSKEISGNQSDFHPLAGKIVIRTNLGGTNIIPAVRMKRNAFDVLMRNKK